MLLAKWQRLSPLNFEHTGVVNREFDYRGLRQIREIVRQLTVILEHNQYLYLNLAVPPAGRIEFLGL